MSANRLGTLQTRIRHELSSRAHLIVGIDGAPGVGKSTLAKQLTEEFDGLSVSLDDYLDAHKGTYLPHLDFQRLKKDIHAHLDQDAPLLTIEGLCLPAVLDKVGTNPNILVYIKCLDNDGEWHDQAICDENRDLTQILRYIKKYETLIGIGDSDKELARYHNNYRPTARADFILSRIIGPDHDIF